MSKKNFFLLSKNTQNRNYEMVLANFDLIQMAS